MEGYAGMPLSLVERQDDGFDETDLSFITKLAAIGDSYSAGIGAGNALGSVLDVLDAGSGKSPPKPLSETDVFW